MSLNSAVTREPHHIDRNVFSGQGLNHNWAFDNDQARYISGLKTILNRIPRQLKAGTMALVYAAERNPDFATNQAALHAVKAAAARVARKGQYLAAWKIPQKVIASKEETKKLAGELAQQCFTDMVEAADAFDNLPDYEQKLQATYDKVCQLSVERLPQVTPPFYGTDPVTEVMECALLRLQCEKWWNRKLQKLRRQHLETLEIMAGAVGKNASPYASHRAISEFVRDKAAQRRWAESLVMINEAGDQLDLIQAIDASIANPENARAELMKRIRGLEEYAEEIGYSAVFMTVTAPSKYHASSQHWNGQTPRQTSKYMVETWALARAQLKRDNQHYFGVRVAEPHQDGTPHWHIMLFCPADSIKGICRVVRRYFCEHHLDELMARFKNRKLLRRLYRQARKNWGYQKSLGRKVAEPRKFYMPFQPRFDAEIIDPAKGSAAAYVAKYISKNINGFEVSELIDSETGKTLGDGVVNVKTWASTWGIRQFQFQGCDPITAYREIRRVREAFAAEHQAELEQLRQAAESNNFVDFIRAMRNINTKIAYDVVPYGNEYGEAVRKIKGVRVGKELAVTRLHKWQLQRRAALKDGASHQSWTCGTNCTGSPGAGNQGQKPVPTKPMPPKSDLHGIGPEEMAILQRGCTVNVNGQRWKLRYGTLEQIPEPPNPSQRVNFVVRRRKNKPAIPLPAA